MNNEAISMCKHLTYAIVREDFNAQYHWASLIALDARANGARGPEAEDAITTPPIAPRCGQCEQRFQDHACGPTHAQVNAELIRLDALKNGTPKRSLPFTFASLQSVRPGDVIDAEDQIEEARR